MNIIIALLVFGVIIFVHELGHFLLAKKNGITVNEFAIGMGPTLFSFKKKETKYSLKLLPMGGYCLMLGEDEEVDDENAFGNKSVWARFSVLFAGSFFNFLLAFVLSLFIVSYIGYDSCTIDQLMENGGAEAAGVQIGDEIIKIDGNKIYNYREVLVFMHFHKKSEPVDLTVMRGEEEMTFSITPTPVPEEDRYVLGVTSKGRVKADNAFEVAKYGFLEIRYQIKATFLGLKQLVTGQLTMDSLAGPVGIVSMMSETIDEAKELSEDGGEAFINILLNIISFCILLSANLGVMNLLPIPALDGGRILFLMVELVSQKKIPTEKEALVNMIGFVILIGLMIIVMFNDIGNLFVK